MKFLKEKYLRNTNQIFHFYAVFEYIYWPTYEPAFTCSKSNMKTSETTLMTLL